MTASEALQLLIRINRILDASACTWTGEAKAYVFELDQWSKAHDWASTPDLLPLREAIEVVAGKDFTPIHEEILC